LLVCTYVWVLGIGILKINIGDCLSARFSVISVQFESELFTDCKPRHVLQGLVVIVVVLGVVDGGLELGEVAG
jgi:hypothetical protein